MLPKVRTPGDVEMTDKLLSQIELAHGATSPAGSASRRRSRTPTGLIACEAIATASPRMETLIFGPGDYSAAVGIPITTIGGAPAGLPRRPPQLRLLPPRGRRARGRHPGRSTARTPRSRTRTGCAPARSSPARSGWTASGRSTPVRSRSSTRSSRPAARSGSAPRRCSPPTSARARARPRRGHVRRRDDRRGEPQDGRAARHGGPRGRLRAGARLRQPTGRGQERDAARCDARRVQLPARVVSASRSRSATTRALARGRRARSQPDAGQPVPLAGEPDERERLVAAQVAEVEDEVAGSRRPAASRIASSTRRQLDVAQLGADVDHAGALAQPADGAARSTDAAVNGSEPVTLMSPLVPASRRGA